jgi:hypothetical protein
MKRVALAFTAIMLLACGVLADQGHHHEELTQDQLGKVHFPVSCVPTVQPCPSMKLI